MKLKAITSQDSFPASQRLYMIYNMFKKELSVFKHGKEATEQDVYSALWSYHQSLNDAEKQISKLLQMINYLMDEGQCIDIDQGYPDYLEEYPNTGDEALRYKLEELKEAFFVATARQDESKASRYINQINLIEDKSNQKQLAS